MHVVVCNRCHHAHIIFPEFVLFVVILARISYVCSSATRGEVLSHVVPRPLLRLGSTRAIW